MKLKKLICTAAVASIMAIAAVTAQATDETGTITYDLAGYAKETYTKDTAATETTYKGLEGLTFYDVNGGGGNDHNWWTVKNGKYGFELYANAYIAYTPTVAGTLSVTGYNAYNITTSVRQLFITDDFTDYPYKTMVVDNVADPTTGSLPVNANTTYYITSKSPTRITNIAFTPDAPQTHDTAYTFEVPLNSVLSKTVKIDYTGGENSAAYMSLNSEKIPLVSGGGTARFAVVITAIPNDITVTGMSLIDAADAE